VSEYFDALRATMGEIARDKNVVFIGQAVACEGTAMSRTLDLVPAEQKVEFPVAEDMQMGFAIGMALRGLVPVCCYPRWNFLLLAMNQLVLHLDKLPEMTRHEVRPRVIIRVAVATDEPMHPGPQHVGDFLQATNLMLKTVLVSELSRADEIARAYRGAMMFNGASIISELSRLY
jgi:pyruvate/2-oxoglutarate/acetoin dehydrogenase E1 component